MMARIDFDHSYANVTGTKPQKLRLGDWYCEPSTWAKAMEMTARAMLSSVHHRDKLLKTIHSLNGIGAVPATLRRPLKLEANLWLEANKSAQDSLRTIVALLKAAEFPLEEACVEYESDSQQGKDALEASLSSKAENETVALAQIMPSKESHRKPAKEVAEKIGAYAKREIYAALAEERVPDDEFAKLQTLEGTKELLGVSLTTCPMFSLSPMTRRDGRHGCWSDAASRNGEQVYVNSQWHEEHRPKLEKLLARWSAVKPQGESAAQLMNNRFTARQIEGKVLTTDYDKNLAELLEAEFPNGVRPGSIIDKNKIRKAYLQWFDEELPENLDLESLLPKIGLIHDGKVFPISLSAKHSPESFVKSLEGRSHGIFFFDALFDAEADTFTSMGVLSGEMLRTILKKTVPDTYVYGRSFFTLPGSPHTVADAIESAFRTVMGEWLREELESFFPYVPADMLVSVLAQDDRFVRVAEGTYRLLSGILLDEDECRQVAVMASEEVYRTGFFTMTADLFKRSLERNGDISPSAIQTAFFERFLSNRFDRHGKVVCVKDAPFDSKMAIRAFCRDNDEVTMEELLQLEQEFGLGGGNRSISTAHEEMVRVSEERFVAPRFVQFDVAAIDAALDSLVPPSGVLPLLSVRSFVSFPAIPGLEWNVYLLEAFLRRTSASFAYLSVSAAPRTACGAIVRRSAGFATVTDALARAVVEAGVAANEKEVGDFLIAQGYIQRRRGVEKDVAEAARRLPQTVSEGDV